MVAADADGGGGSAGDVPLMRGAELPHASIKMTQRYAHLAPDYLGREVARLNFAAPVEGKILPLHTARQVP